MGRNSANTCSKNWELNYKIQLWTTNIVIFTSSHSPKTW
jgi:hypothetical protein